LYGDVFGHTGAASYEYAAATAAATTAAIDAFPGTVPPSPNAPISKPTFAFGSTVNEIGILCSDTATGAGQYVVIEIRILCSNPSVGADQYEQHHVL